VHTILSNGSSSHDRWETFSLTDIFLSSSYSTGAIGGFEVATRGFKGATTSSGMIEFSPTSIKTKRIVGTIWYLHLGGSMHFI
jgi:hypothetical protein